jgi:hypothetical protein
LRSERTPIFVAITVLALMSGCQAVRVQQPLTNTTGGSSSRQQLDFWHGLADRPVVCNDEAFHGLLLFFDGSDPAATYAARVEALRSRKMLPAGFDAPGDEAVSRGTLAIALVRGLKMEGGWALTLLGPTPRYATRELVYRGVYPASSPWQTLTGNELVGIMGKAEDFQRGDLDGQPAVDIAVADHAVSGAGRAR